MAVPSKFIQIQCAPDVNGFNLVESWNNLNKWDTVIANWFSGLVSIDSDAGLGGACIKLDPNGTGNEIQARSKVWFDNTQPFAWKAKYKRSATPIFNSFVGLQVGETHYYQIRQDGFVNTISPGMGQGYLTLENPAAIGTPANNTVNEYEVEYYPGNPSYIRYRKDGGVWATLHGDKAWLQQGDTYQVPRFLVPFAPVFHMFAGDGEILRAGKLQMTGAPMWGAADDFCWSDWEYEADPGGTQQCARIAGLEIGPVNLGGLTRRPVYNASHLPGDFPAGDDGKGRTSWLESLVLKPSDLPYAGVPPTGLFKATGPQIFPEDGYKYSQIRLQRYIRPATSDYAKVYVRAANAANGYAAGDLLSDSHVPDNSNGLVNAAYFNDGKTLYDVQYVNVAIPPGTAIYFEIEGSTTGVDATSYLAKDVPGRQADWDAQTRLQGVWLSFAEDAAYTWELPGAGGTAIKNFDGTTGGTIKNFDGSTGGVIKDWP